jgi:hypothetical protein
MLATSVAKFTLASLTPGTALSAFSTRATQDAQLIPSMDKDHFAMGTDDCNEGMG